MDKEDPMADFSAFRQPGRDADRAVQLALREAGHLRCPVREIAAHVGKPEGTVKYELYRLRAALQRFLS
jgi:DNA-directed RNA polymerase specialized sigma24 family protein